MRKLYVLLPLLFALACSKPASESSAAASDAPSTSGPVSEADLETATEAPAEPGDDTRISVFAGTIEYIPFVMYLEMPGAAATGHYFYTKQGKRIDLTGSFDAGEGTYALTEQVAGKTTGYFNVMLSDEAISGTWRAKQGQGEALNVEGRRLDVPYEPNGTIGKRISGKYSTSHPVSDMSDENAPETEVKDYMAVRYIGGGYLSFYLNVTGANFHTGEVSGLAKMTDDTHAKTEADDCDLRFEFRGNSVDITEEDCGDYHGARASFDVALTKE